MYGFGLACMYDVKYETIIWKMSLPLQTLEICARSKLMPRRLYAKMNKRVSGYVSQAMMEIYKIVHSSGCTVRAWIWNKVWLIPIAYRYYTQKSALEWVHKNFINVSKILLMYIISVGIMCNISSCVYIHHESYSNWNMLGDTF